jgi:hypothetical protein
MNRRIIFAVIFMIVCSFSKKPDMKKESVYNVYRLQQSMKIDGNWDKPQWQNSKTIEITNFMGEIPKFRPVAQAKMMYDGDNIYVIFRVQDRYVRCIAKNFNDRVYEDACVEFFFSPDTDLPLRYFNLETNCGGTALMRYNIIPRKESKMLENSDFEKIEIAHSMPKIVDPEITEPITWTIEYKIPLSMLEKFSKITRPKQGASWRANFYKIAEKGSNIHFITWSVVEQEKPDFHLPQFFGILKFQ